MEGPSVIPMTLALIQKSSSICSIVRHCLLSSESNKCDLICLAKLSFPIYFLQHLQSRLLPVWLYLHSFSIQQLVPDIAYQFCIRATPYCCICLTSCLPCSRKYKTAFTQYSCVFWEKRLHSYLIFETECISYNVITQRSLLYDLFIYTFLYVKR